MLRYVWPVSSMSWLGGALTTLATATNTEAERSDGLNTTCVRCGAAFNGASLGVPKPSNTRSERLELGAALE